MAEDPQQPPAGDPESGSQVRLSVAGLLRRLGVTVPPTLAPLSAADEVDSLDGLSRPSGGGEPDSTAELEALRYEDTLDVSGTQRVRALEMVGDLERVGPLLGRFEIRGELGIGGMGVVYDAWDPELRRAVAVKILHEGGQLDANRLGRFVAEAQITSQLDHPNIVPVHEIGATADGRIFFAMKKVVGISLRDLLARLEEEEDEELLATWTTHRLLSTFALLCQTCAYAHRRGVLHRDLKPSNVMLGPYGEIQVMDWGVARLMGDVSEVVRSGALGDSRVEHASIARTLDGQAIGTPGYMSPEQARGELSRLDARSDVWSLGAILYELLARTRAYKADSVAALLFQTIEGPPPLPSDRAPDRDIDPEIEDVCMRAMALRPADRFADAEELAAAVESFQEGSARRALERRKQRRRMVVVAVAGVLLLGAAAFLGAQWQRAEKAYRLTTEALRETRVRTLIAEAQAPSLAGDPAQRVALLRAAAAVAGERDGPGDDHAGLEALALAGLATELDPSGLSAVLRAHERDVEVLVFSDEGDLLVSGDATGRALLWSVDTGTHRVLPVDGAVRAAAFSPTRREIALGLESGLALVSLDDHHTLRPLATGEPALAVAWSPDGDAVAVGSAGGVGVFERSGAPRWRAAASGLVDSVSWSGARVYASASPGVFDASTGAATVTARTFLTERRAVGGYQYGATLGGGLARLDVEGDELRRLSTLGPIRELAPAPTGRAVAAAGGAGRLDLWTDAGGEQPQSARVALDGHTDAVTQLAWSLDGDWLATAGDDRTVHLWDGRTGGNRAALRGHDAPVTALAWSRSGRLLASASKDGVIRLWHAQEGGARSVLLGPRRPVEQTRPLPGGAVTAQAGTTAWIWTPDDGRVQAVLEPPDRPVWRLVPGEDGVEFLDTWGDFHRWQDGALVSETVANLTDAPTDAGAVGAGRLLLLPGSRVAFQPARGEPATAAIGLPGKVTGPLAWSGDQGTLGLVGVDRAWFIDPAGRELGSIEAPGLRAVILAGAGRRAALVDEAGVRVVDVASGELVGRLGQEGDEAWVAPDGERVLVREASGALTLWTATGESVMDFARLRGQHDAVAWSPTAQRLAAGGEDGTIHVWDSHSGALVGGLRGHQDRVTSLSFDASGRRLISGAADRTVRVWDLASLPAPGLWFVHSGTRNNLRVCREGLTVVPVTPYPPATEAWAPPEACTPR